MLHVFQSDFCQSLKLYQIEKRVVLMSKECFKESEQGFHMLFRWENVPDV